MLICTLGDLLLDVIVRLRQPLAPGDDAVAETQTAPGGQAANVAAWVAHIGERGRFVGKRGSDETGVLVTDALRSRGVEVVGPESGRNGVVVSLVEPEGARTMASDRGVAPQLAPDELDARWFDGCDWLHIAGYSLALSPIREAAVRAAGYARDAGARLSVDLSSWTVIEAAGAAEFGEAVDAIAPDLLFATERELEALPEVESPAVVVKRGPKGFRVGRNGRFENYAAVRVEPIDTTGAGDALAAGFLVGGPKLAAETAARCIARVGAMP